MSELKPKNLKVAELREELSKRGLDTKGLKADLVARLTEALEEAAASDAAVKALQAKQDIIIAAKEEEKDKEEGVGRVMVEGDAEVAQELEDAVKETKEAKEIEKMEPAALDPEVAKVVAEEEVKERIPDLPPSPVRRISPLPASKPPSPSPPAAIAKIASPLPENAPDETMEDEPAPAAPVPASSKDHTSTSSGPSKDRSSPKILTPPVEPTPLPPARAKRSRSPSPPNAPTGPKRRRTYTTLLPSSLSHLVHPPTTILYIRNLRRPLQNSALHEYLYPSSTPAPSSGSALLPPPVAPFASSDNPGLWISGIKDHAYAAYPSVEDAIEAAERIDGKRFPEETGEVLGVEFVDDEQVRGFVDREEFAWRNGRQKMVLRVREDGGEYIFDLRVDLGNGRGLPGPRGAPGGTVLGAPPTAPPGARAVSGLAAGGLSIRGTGGPGRGMPLAGGMGGGGIGRPLMAGQGGGRYEEGRIGRPMNRTKVRPNLMWREGPGAAKA